MTKWNLFLACKDDPRHKKSINIIHEFNRMEGRNHVTISTDAEKSFFFLVLFPLSVCLLFPFSVLSCFVLFLGLHPWHMQIPRLGVELELQMLAYTTATATRVPSHVCNLHHRSRQRRILNPLIEARNRTCNLMVPSRIHFCCTMTGTPEDSLRPSFRVVF